MTGLKQDYDPDLDGKVLAAQPIGVPGAAMPLQMQGHKPSFAPNGPSPMKTSGAPGTGDELVDAGDVLPGYGFQGLKVTMNELADLAKDLSLDEKGKSKPKTKAAAESSGTGKSQSGAPPDLSRDSTTAPIEKVGGAEDKALDSSEPTEEKAAPPSLAQPAAAEADNPKNDATVEAPTTAQPPELGEIAKAEEKAN